MNIKTFDKSTVDENCRFWAHCFCFHQLLRSHVDRQKPYHAMYTFRNLFGTLLKQNTQLSHLFRKQLSLNCQTGIFISLSFLLAPRPVNLKSVERYQLQRTRRVILARVFQAANRWSHSASNETKYPRVSLFYSLSNSIKQEVCPRAPVNEDEDTTGGKRGNLTRNVGRSLAD